jgi:hypothetical protein
MYNASYNNAGNNSVAAHAYRAPFQRTDVQVQPEPYMTNEVITPERAAKMLQSSDGNRPHYKSASELYKKQMKADNWVVGEPIQFDWNGKLLNGHHRLQAISECDRPVKILVIWNLDPAVKAFMDQGTKRTPGHAFSMANITNANVSAATSKYLYFYLTGGKHKPTRGLTQELIAFWQMHDLSIKNKNAYSICAVPSALTAAEVLLTKYQDPDKVSKFMDVLLTGIQPSTDDVAIIHLRNALIAKRGSKVNPLEYMSQVFKVYGYWINKKSVNHIKLATKDTEGVVYSAKTLSKESSLPNTFPNF